VDGSKYFWYHHTNADTFDKVDRDELNRCMAAMAIMAFVLADLEDPLPR
jgi:carboxypeptidase Q